MTISQKQSLLNEIEAFEAQDYNSIFAHNNSDTANIESVMAADYHVEDLIFQSQKVVSVIKHALDSDDWVSLPFNYSVAEYGQLSLTKGVNSLKSYLLNGNYTGAVTPLNILVNYARCVDIWSPTSNIESRIHDESLTKLENRADTLQKHIEARIKKIDMMISELEDIKVQISNLFAQSQTEATNLSKAAQNSGTILADIKGTQGSVNTISESISNTNRQCAELLKKLNDLLDKSTTTQSEIFKKNEEIESTIISLNDIIRQESETVKKVYDETLESENRVKELMSYISDGTLAHSFNQRKRAVNKASYVWLALGGVSSIALVVIICILFTSSKIDMTNLWADIVMKSLKTFPIACMALYFFKEYSKERALTEEYAFREAVAITLKAYLDQLEGEEDENKRNLLLQTVEKLYTKPTFSEKQERAVNIKTKDMVDALDKLAECLKTIKSK